MVIAPTRVHPQRSEVRSRVAWADRLRIWLTVLVVAHHAADTYATISGWYVPEPGKDAGAMALTVFIIVNQAYFMGVFFMLSGLFVPGSADRKGLGRFTRDRLVRLGVPILAYFAIIRPLCLIPAALYLRDQAAAAGTSFSIARFLAFGGDPGVTWFLEVLLVLTLGYALIRLRARRRPPAPGVGRPAALLAFVGVLSMATWVWQWCTPPGTYWPIVGLPTPSFLPQYALFFIVGVAASRRGWLESLPRSYAIPAALALLVGAALYGPMIGSPVDIHHLTNGALSASGQALFAVGAAVLLVLAFRTLFARPAGRLTRFMADQSFVVYLIHPVVLVGVAKALDPVQAPAVEKALLLFAIAAPLSWCIGRLLRRARIVRAVS